jgi:hypothetical protein
MSSYAEQARSLAIGYADSKDPCLRNRCRSLCASPLSQLSLKMENNGRE